jgi:hypothetical protein
MENRAPQHSAIRLLSPRCDFERVRLSVRDTAAGMIHVRLSRCLQSVKTPPYSPPPSKLPIKLYPLIKRPLVLQSSKRETIATSPAVGRLSAQGREVLYWNAHPTSRRDRRDPKRTLLTVELLRLISTRNGHRRRPSSADLIHHHPEWMLGLKISSTSIACVDAFLVLASPAAVAAPRPRR